MLRLSMTALSYRYHLPKRAIKGDCPQCSPRHRKTLSRFIDSHTGELLPAEYGRCDRESNCGYFLSPYDKGASGMSYSDETYNAQRENKPITARPFANRPTPQPTTTTPITAKIYTVPDEVFKRTIGHYGRNQFAYLLQNHFGQQKADDLLRRFLIGTATYWPGACVFWIVDERQRPRGGQLVLFADDWHKARYADQEGNQQPCISSVSHGLLRQYRSKGKDAPTWLTDYHLNAPRWPVPFGLHQLATAPRTQPVAIVEAPKTAVLSSGYFPEFIWLAIGAKSYLNAERLAALRGRKIMLYPDLNAYHDTQSHDGKPIKGWVTVARKLHEQGFHVDVSDILEQHATEQQRAEGLDLADFLLQQPPRSSDSWPPPGSVSESIPVDAYPPEWDMAN